MKGSFPERIRKITSRFREVIGGALTEGEFFRSHTGEGVYWEMIEQLFGLAKRRAGLTENEASTIPDTLSSARSRASVTVQSGGDMKHRPGFLQLVEQARRR
jgi:hypothetical protein